MGKKFQKKRKTEQLEIVPMDENPPLPPQRPSDEVIPKRVCIATFVVWSKTYFFHSNAGKMD